MFSDIGGKIKVLAKVICWVGIICSVIIGAILIGSLLYSIAGIVIIVLGSLLSWVSSFVLYGFGQLIQNTDQLVLHMQKPHTVKKQKSINEGETKLTEDYTYSQNTKSNEGQKDIPQKQTPEDFLRDIKETETADLELILKDQTELYSEEEISIIKKELSSRKE